MGEVMKKYEIKECLIDTDIFSYYMRDIPHVVARAEEYLKHFRRFNISSLTVFEILKGLRKRGLVEKERCFRTEIAKHNILGLDYPVMDRAATLLTGLEKKGTPVAYGDMFIASVALAHNLRLVTNNVGHFSKVGELVLENWMD